MRDTSGKVTKKRKKRDDKERSERKEGKTGETERMGQHVSHGLGYIWVFGWRGGAGVFVCF